MEYFLLQRQKIALQPRPAPGTLPWPNGAMAEGGVQYSRFPLELQEKWALAPTAEVSQGGGGAKSAIAPRKRARTPSAAGCRPEPRRPPSLGVCKESCVGMALFWRQASGVPPAPARSRQFTARQWFLPFYLRHRNGSA